MRRYSLFLAAALITISALVSYTLKLRIDKARSARVFAPPAIKPIDEGIAPSGWEWKKDDPVTGPVVRVRARSYEGTRDPSTFELKGVALRLYDKRGKSYTFVRTEQAIFDEGSGVLKSEAAVYIVMNVPATKDAEDPREAAKRVRVTTSGITYETKSGKASTNQPASFVFTEGDGKAVGGEYDPNTKVLHLKSQVTLDWIGKGSAANKMHIETNDLVYKEAEGKIYLSPWSRMTRKSTRIAARNTLILLENHHLHQIFGDCGVGSDERADRHTSYSADKLSALFDDKGVMVQMIGEGGARVETIQPGSRTLLTGTRADLRFAAAQKLRNGESVADSELHLVMADGHSVAESDPLPQPGVLPADTRILRSEHIELEMKPDGKDLKEIRTSAAGQLEFKPNRPDQPHRIVDASRMRVVYGKGSYVDTFLAGKAVTYTDKAASRGKKKLGAGGKPVPAAQAITWSDELTAKFLPNSNQVASIGQSGNFRYEEGARKAWAKQALLEQQINRITLTERARVMDDTGSAVGDKIVMNQNTGDMDASGHVVSTHEPNPKETPGTSMLDATEPMQAQADNMQTREDNSQIFYEGHVVMWQGGDRISADRIVIDRDKQALDAAGHVVSELVDNKSAPGTVPIYTVVHAPKLSYRDDTRVADYTGGVKLVRGKMTVTSENLQALLTPKSSDSADGSSLDHGIATGDVKVVDVISPGRTRTGTGERCEYYTQQDKVILSGGSPQMIDSYKGVIHGDRLTYFSGEDHLLVDGKKEKAAFTKMKKK